MKACNRCGNVNLDAALFCAGCGKPLPAPAAPTAVGASSPAGARSADQAPTAAPFYVPVLGLISILFGPALAALNWLLVPPTIANLEGLGAGPASTTTLWVVIWVLTAVGALCALSGVGLLLRRRWGRWMSFLYAAAALLGLLIAGCGVQVSQNLAEAEINEKGGAGFGGPTYVEYVGAVPALAPLYGLVLVVGLNLRGARAWARRSAPELAAARAAAGATGPRPPDVAPPKELSVLALLSLVVSLVPCMLLTQTAALVMGLIALRRIKRSEGQLGGRGMALAGVVISASILTCIGGLIGAGLTAVWLREGPLKPPELVEVGRLSLDKDEGVSQLAFSPSGRLLLTEGADAGVTVWDASGGTRLWRGGAGEGPHAFSESGTEVVALIADRDRAVLLSRDAWTGVEVGRRATHTRPPGVVAFNRGRPALVGGVADEQVFLWSMETGEQVASFAAPKRPDGDRERPQTLGVSPDGRQVLLVGQETLYLCDAADGTVLRRFPAKEGTRDRLLFTPDGGLALAAWQGAANTESVEVLDLRTGTSGTFGEHRWSASCLDLTPDGTLAVSGGRTAGDADYIVIGGGEEAYGGEVIVWKPQDRRRVARTFAVKGSVARVAIAPDGRRVAAADKNGAVVLFDLKR